jgi:hypothetical protein
LAITKIFLYMAELAIVIKGLTIEIIIYRLREREKNMHCQDIACTRSFEQSISSLFIP